MADKYEALSYCGISCAGCGSFPCDTLNGFYHDGNPQHRRALEAMEEIIRIGADAWLENIASNTSDL